MISFKEFLATQGERLRAEHSALVQDKERWIAAVVNLIEQLEEWVKESDPDQEIVVVEHQFRDADPFSRDGYANAKLTIRIGAESASIQPVAMNTLGPRWKPGEGRWAGRVDMSGDPYGYELFRFVYADDHEGWFLRSTRDYQMKPLDQLSFDAALVDVFS